MDFSFSDDQQSIRDLARRILGDKVTDDYLRHFAAEQNADYDQALWRVLGEAGLTGLCVAESEGGSGMGFMELCLLLEEQGRCLAPLPLLWSLVCAALPVQTFGSAEQKQRSLTAMIAGSGHMTAALEEFAHHGGIPFSAVRRNEQWHLQGSSYSVPFASGASQILVPARTEQGITLFLIDPAAPGAALSRQLTSNYEAHYQLCLQDFVCDDQAQLGDAGVGDAQLEWILQRAWTAIAAMQLGVLEEALRRTADYVSERRQFGRPLAAFQAVSHRAANAYIDCEALRSTYWQAAWQISEGKDAALAARSAKWWACEAGHRVSHTFQHLHGGIGADIEYPIHRFFLWAKQLEFTLGGARQSLANAGACMAANDQWEVTV